MKTENPIIPFFRTAYNYDTLKVSDETGLSCPEKTLTQQQFKDEVDVNEILRKFNITGQLPDNFTPPQYGDFTGIDDFQSAMNAVISAQNSFMELPANVRDFFANDPQRLLEFISNPENAEQAFKLGLTTQYNPPSEGLSSKQGDLAAEGEKGAA